MPIGLQTPIKGHTGNGVTTTFAYNFGILSAVDLKVMVAGSLLTTGYTVTGVGNRSGGTVVFSAPPATGAAVLLYRSVSRDRATDYQTNGDLRADVLDDDLDRIVMALQEDAEILTRVVRAPTGESLGELAAAASRANKVLTFGPGGAIALVDVAAFVGGGVVELVPEDGSITPAKLDRAYLPTAGGTMTAPLTLPGNAANALEAVPKQQAETIAAAVAAEQARTASALSFSGLALSATGKTQSVTVAAGELLLRAADGSPRLVSGVNVTISTATAGVNGLDTGTITGPEWYAVWVIHNGTTAAGLLSLSATAPTMPAGYTHRARVGYIRTDGSGGRLPLGFTQVGRRVQYRVDTTGNVPNLPQMATGTAGDTSAPAFATVAVGAFVPPTAGVIDVLARIGNNSSLLCAPNGQFGGVGSSANPAPMSLIINATTYGGVTRGALVLESRNVFWACVGGGVLACVGWEDNL